MGTDIRLFPRGRKYTTSTILCSLNTFIMKNVKPWTCLITATPTKRISKETKVCLYMISVQRKKLLYRIIQINIIIMFQKRIAGKQKEGDINIAVKASIKDWETTPCQNIQRFWRQAKPGREWIKDSDLEGTLYIHMKNNGWDSPISIAKERCGVMEWTRLH